MKIKFLGISQSDFEYAFECLENCKQTNAVDYGFNYPYFTPGGDYGEQWWQLDSSLALCGYKWKDRKFVETSLLNFIETQKLDGRICLWGKDILPKQVAGGDLLQQNEGVSSLPKIFDIAYNIVKSSNDKVLIAKTYSMLKRYLDWWYNERYDRESGLITSVFEECFIPYLGSAMEYASVDTNVEVYVGLIYTADLAKILNDTETVKKLQDKAKALKTAINTHLWDDEKGAYYPFDLTRKIRINRLMASTFYPLRLKIAPSKYKKRLIELLKNHDKFNWDTIPLTSVSKDDSIFQITNGVYIGNRSWSGNVWTLINEMVIRGLMDSDERELAVELALKTIFAFNNKYTEFINPFDGSGNGVLEYAWTASQYLELIIEIIFGVSSNAYKKEVSIIPNISEDLKKTEISITNLMVFDGVYLDVFIDKGKINYKISNKTIKVNT